MRIYTAAYVLPISSDPIPNGAIAIDGTKIAAVGPAADVIVKFPGTESEDLGHSAVIPGLVNCHAHLELTSMRGALDDVEHDFRSWLLKLNDIRSSLSEDDIQNAAFIGAKEAASAGVTCVGDIGRIGRAGLNALKGVGLRGIVFQETEFSPDVRTAEADFLTLAKRFEELVNESTDLVALGISPHSPYTVSSTLFELIAQYSILNRVPITIHAAESASEMELLTKGTGFFNDVYEKYGFEWYSPHCSPIAYLDRLGVLSARPLLAHCVFTDDDDISRISSNGISVAHCPKSNAKFGHGYAPFEKMLDAGVTVGLGSDSVASNNTCDIFEESRFAALAARNRCESLRFLSARELLETATIGGANAMGLGDKIGSLEVGKEADLAVISLSTHRQTPINDIHSTLIFSTSGADVSMTMVAGQEVFKRTEPTT
jgi:cytosine/adenosine deaminase-related metal-dependent hydrolase